MERQLKERLIGAALLITLIVVVAPEMFSGAPQPASVSAVEPGQVQTYQIDLQAPANAGSAASQSEPAEQSASDRESARIDPPAAAPADELTRSKSAPPRTLAEASTRASAAASASSAFSSRASSSSAAGAGMNQAASGRFVVQVGSFGARERAEQVATRAQALGASVSVAPIKAGGKTLYRVRSGLLDRAAADAALRRIRADYPDAKVVSP